jgi:DNA-binding response OmpR family regulator
MRRRILLVDDDLAVLLTLKAVLELQGFEVDTASSSSEAFARLQSGVYQMVISDLRMETEESGLEVLRNARRQPYHPATALLTAYPPSWDHESDESLTPGDSDSVLIKPLGISDLLRQVEVLLIRQADHRQADNNQTGKSRTSKEDKARHKQSPKAEHGKRHAS